MEERSVRGSGEAIDQTQTLAKWRWQGGVAGDGCRSRRRTWTYQLREVGGVHRPRSGRKDRSPEGVRDEAVPRFPITTRARSARVRRVRSGYARSRAAAAHGRERDRDRALRSGPCSGRKLQSGGDRRDRSPPAVRSAILRRATSAARHEESTRRDAAEHHQVPLLRGTWRYGPRCDDDDGMIDAT